MTDNAILTAHGVTVGYGGVAVTRDIDLSLAPGELLAIVGHNGSGKSSLIKSILGLIPTLAGRLQWHQGAAKPHPKPKRGTAGRAQVTHSQVTHVTHQVAYLGQRQDLDRSFPMKCADLVASGGWNLSGPGALFGLGGVGKPAAALERAAKAAIAQVGLGQVAHLPLHALSGGQLQRALFARAIVQDAPVIVLDEPFAGVDQKTEADLLDLILQWSGQGRAVILVSHDLSSVLTHATNALLLGDGRARFGEPCLVLSSSNLVDHGYMSAGQAQWLAGMYGGNGAGAL